MSWLEFWQDLDRRERECQAALQRKKGRGHRCHARGCTVPVKPELLMCLKHWRMVPKELQREVWRHYRPGQCDDKHPSEAWHKAADAAINHVARLEARC